MARNDISVSDKTAITDGVNFQAAWKHIMLDNFLVAFHFSIGVTLPTVFLLLFGLFLQRTGQINGAFSQAASKLMFNWALPALLFFAIIESKVELILILKRNIGQNTFFVFGGMNKFFA